MSSSFVHCCYLNVSMHDDVGVHEYSYSSTSMRSSMKQGQKASAQKRKKKKRNANKEKGSRHIYTTFVRLTCHSDHSVIKYSIIY